MVFAQTAETGPNYTGNCLSQTITFNDTKRIFSLGGLPSVGYIPELDVSRYDFTIDYHAEKVSYPSSGGVTIKVTPSAKGDGTTESARMSSTRLFQYGRVTAKMKVPPVPGIVTTFITMGPWLPDSGLGNAPVDKQGGDEIDFEFLGKNPNQVETNIFYRGVKELSARGGAHAVQDYTQFHTYTIDWKRETIQFLIDNQVVRTYTKSGPEADSKYLDKSKRYFPDRAQKVAFSLWSDPNNQWSGGIPQWPTAAKEASATYEYIKFECYDDKDQVVPKWPLTNNPGRRAAFANQPTAVSAGKIPAGARPDATPGPGDGSNLVETPKPTGNALAASISLFASLTAVMAMILSS
jgi:beta-glucanase (GH16 family)